MKAVHYWPFVRELRRRPVVLSHKGSVIRMASPCHYVIMTFAITCTANGDKIITEKTSHFTKLNANGSLSCYELWLKVQQREKWLHRKMHKYMHKCMLYQLAVLWNYDSVSFYLVTPFDSNSLASGKCDSDFESIHFKLIVLKSSLATRYEIVLKWIPQNLTDYKSLLLQANVNPDLCRHMRHIWPQCVKKSQE